MAHHHLRYVYIIITCIPVYRELFHLLVPYMFMYSLHSLLCCRSLPSKYLKLPKQYFFQLNHVCPRNGYLGWAKKKKIANSSSRLVCGVFDVSTKTNSMVSSIIFSFLPDSQYSTRYFIRSRRENYLTR